jgi:hypothetical protein
MIVGTVAALGAAVMVYLAVRTDVVEGDAVAAEEVSEPPREPRSRQLAPMETEEEWDRRIRREMESSYVPPTPEEIAEADRRVKEHRAKRRAIERYQWEAPSETRARLWNIPEEEHDEATATAFLRICLSEADGAEADCLGIWQVLRNNRSRSCDRRRTRITECDEDGETMLSSMKRHSASVLGVYSPRTKRSRWIANVELSCEQPRNWYGTKREWQRMYASHRCPRVAKLARQLVAGDTEDIDWPIEGVRAITWGGRCESGRGACDDDHACRRKLARIFTDTHNAFWCRPGRPGCAPDIDEVCIKRGFPSLLQKRVAENDEPEPPAEPIPTPQEQVEAVQEDEIAQEAQGG